MEYAQNRINIFDKSGNLVFSINTDVEPADLMISIVKALRDRD